MSLLFSLCGSLLLCVVVFALLLLLLHLDVRWNCCCFVVTRAGLTTSSWLFLSELAGLSHKTTLPQGGC